MKRPGVEFAEPRKCAICTNPFMPRTRDDHVIVRLSTRRTHYGDFAIRRCENCGTGVTSPQPTIETAPLLYAHEPPNAHAATATGTRAARALVDRLKHVRADRRARRATGGRIVRDVLVFGSNDVHFEASLRRVLPNARVVVVCGYETQAPGRNALARRIERRNLEAFARSRDRFDLIICRHVIEHEHDPRRVVADLYARLAPRGVLDIEVPNMESGLAHVLGARNPGYHVPHHLFHFTRRSLRSIVPLGAFDEIGTCSMPLMGNVLAEFSQRSPTSPVLQLAGVPLYAFQILADRLWSTSTCLTLRIERPVCAPPDGT